MYSYERFGISFCCMIRTVDSKKEMRDRNGGFELHQYRPVLLFYNTQGAWKNCFLVDIGYVKNVNTQSQPQYDRMIGTRLARGL